MSVVISTSEIRLTKTESGTLRIGNTRVSLDSVIHSFNQGLSPEEIVLDFDSLSLSEVYAAISYYLQNREEVDSYMIERSKQSERLRASIESRFDQKGLRERLLARRNSSD